ncbi:MAG: hypothetical protein U5N55_01495 [Cypionkella sp.]|nr:hypothetical protein [Cypionkella sp.]
MATVTYMMFGAAFFFALGRLCGQDTMSPITYGEMAVKTPAIVWALAQILAAVFVLTGIEINGAWRWSPALRLSGCAGLAVLFSVLSFSALFTGGQFPIAAYASVFTWSYLFFSWLSLLDLIGAFREVAEIDE